MKMATKIVKWPVAFNIHQGQSIGLSGLQLHILFPEMKRLVINPRDRIHSLQLYLHLQLGQ